MRINLPLTADKARLIVKATKTTFALTLFLIISFGGFAQISAPGGGPLPQHSVTLYTATCGAGPQYSIQPTVASVNSTSNYRWQYKDAAGNWICISPGANNIGGSTYNVTGAEYNQTTSPGPLVFTNPNSGLEGLVVRIVIYDGTPLTGCTFPGTVYNGDASSVNHTISVSGTPCGNTPCTAHITSLYFNNLADNSHLPITNGSTFTIAQLGSLYNLEASATGTVGSIKFTITGPTPSSNIENFIPYNSPGTGSGAWTGAAGNYSVNMKAYNGADATGSICHDTTITFILTSNSVSLGNLIWWDKNDNGIKDPGEGGWPFSGLTVNLYQDNNDDGIADGPVVATTTPSTSTGLYQFNNLVPGKYFITLTNPFPVDWQKSSVNGGDPDNDIDNDNNAVSGTSIIKGQTITLAVGTEPDVPVDGDGTNGNQTYDCGLWKGNGLGDYVWLDDNGDGIQQSGEPGIAGVTVTLSKGATVYTTTTDANGFYFFADIYDLANGGYTLTFTTPAGYAPSPANQGGDDSKDSDPIGGVITGITVPIGTWNHTFDAGFTLASLGDRVWKDDDGDGIQDAGEVGIAGVTVVLVNSAGVVVGTTTTDAFGNYKFSRLLPGNYTVRIAPPANYILSAKTQGGNTALDSDFDPVTYTTGTVTLAAGQIRTDIDAGLKFMQPQSASVGDRVWLDTNADGVQDAGEPGVSNVLVTLYNSSGVAVASTYTNANGNYLFTDVVPGNYTVGVSLPPAMVFSPNLGAISVANNSDINPANGRTASFTVNAGDQITYVDAGLKTQQTTNGSVGDFVWNDLNKDGVQDAGEPGIPGVTVRLINATINTVVATTTTDVNGKYIFNDVVPGNYLVEFVAPSGYTTTTRLNIFAPLDGTDSDVDPGTGRTSSFTLAAGDRITSVDAGYWVTTPPGTGKIGDRVWLDANQNGIQDAGEPGVSGITVTLYNSGGTAIKLATTDQNGNYLFTDLAAGNYTVGFSNLPAGFTFTTPGLGTAATGSDASPATGRTGTITLAAGQTNLDVDAGIRSAQAGTGSLGNRVWYDLNNNGLQDAGEVGVQGATIELLDAAGNPIDKDPITPGVQPTTTITNALGEYLFTGLGAGDYKVRFSTLPAGYAVVVKGAGTDRNLDSDGNPLAAGTSTTDVISLSANEDRLDIDLGIFNPTAPLGQIGDRVWFDSNNNGIQDATEQGVPGVSVALLNSAGTVIATTVTDKNGLYRFVNLADATYAVQFSNLPAGFTFSPKDLGGNDNLDNDADPGTGKTGNYVITGGNTDLTVDAGIYSTRAALGDYVWFDANKDGVQDANENGIPGITVTLYDAAGVAVTSMITDQNGRYFFSNLNPGNYTLGFSTIPVKLVFTTKDAPAAGDLLDSDVDPATGRTGTVTLAAGQVNLTVDAGLKPVIPATIGDFVWFDLNKDGIQDAGEPGVPGVVVTLFNSANQPIGSAVSDGNGFYQINNVPPGTGYYVKFSNQPDVTAPWTLQNVGGVGANNNSKVDAAGQTGTFNVAEGQNISNIDAGIFKFINLSGNVWHDANGMSDGLVNSTSPILIPPGLRVYLVNASTGLIEQFVFVNTSTGTFSFSNVNVNTVYNIVLSSSNQIIGNPPPPATLPSGWIHTGQKNANPPNSPLGSDGLNDGKVVVPVGTNNVININFGIKIQGGDVVLG